MWFWTFVKVVGGFVWILCLLNSSLGLEIFFGFFFVFAHWRLRCREVLGWLVCLGFVSLYVWYLSVCRCGVFLLQLCGVIFDVIVLGMCDFFLFCVSFCILGFDLFIVSWVWGFLLFFWRVIISCFELLLSGVGYSFDTCFSCVSGLDDGWSWIGCCGVMWRGLLRRSSLFVLMSLASGGSSVFDVIFCLCDFVVAFHCALLCWAVVGCGLLFFSSI